MPDRRASLAGQDQSVPKPGVLRILRILIETRALFGRTFDDEVYFLGSVTKVQSGQRTWASIGDVDILIGGAQMAENFWTFLGALLERGLKSVWDICYVPPNILDFWKPCRSRKEHPLSLTLDCEANPMTSQGTEFKQYNLDIKLDPSVVSKVPLSSGWMYGNTSNLACGDFGAPILHSNLLHSDMLHSSQDATKFGLLFPLIKAVCSGGSKNP